MASWNRFCAWFWRLVVYLFVSGFSLSVGGVACGHYGVQAASALWAAPWSVGLWVEFLGAWGLGLLFVWWGLSLLLFGWKQDV